MEHDFQSFPKIKRLFRDVVITEKIDGTNGQIYVQPLAYNEVDGNFVLAYSHDYAIYAGSRSRYVTPGKEDNYGFASWVKENAQELITKLGPGRHFGEWWGKGIQRGYGQREKKFSLFNTAKWSLPEVRPSCCDVVPVLYTGVFETVCVREALYKLEKSGSVVAPGFMDTEGVIVYHTASNHLYKYTHDDNHKDVTT